MRLLPRQDVFHKMFGEFAVLLEKAAGELRDAFQRGESAIPVLAERMLQYEREADALGMALFNTLHKCFITPFDPEDIFALIHNLDNVMDGMEDVTHRAAAYGLSPVPETMKTLTGIIHSGVKSVGGALRALEKRQDVIAACITLKQCESDADALTRTAIAKLFAEESDVKSLLKQKEIYEYFETTADACAQVATILGRIHLKNG